MRPALTVILLTLLAGLPMAAKPSPAPERIASYRLDTVHSRLMFEASHAGFSQSMGTFRISSGALQWEAQRVQDATLQVEIDITSLDLGDAEWNRKMLKRPYFDVDSHPTARFQAKRFLPDGDPQQWRIEGELSLNGITRPVSLQARINDERRHPLTFKRTLGVSATATLSRSEFGMDAWPTLIGDEIKLRIESEWTYDGRSDAATPTKDGP